MISVNLYLWIVTVITGFRAFMYIFFLDHVSCVKISPKGWMDVGNREMMHSYCNSILASSIFRLLLNLWAQFSLEDGPSKNAFCVISLILDVMFMLVLTGVVRTVLGRSQGVLIHRNRIPPLTLQSIVLVSGLICVGNNYIF